MSSAGDALTPSLSIVLPCFNEHAVLDETVRRVAAAAGVVTPSFEVVLVNDGSRDSTWDDMVRLSAADTRVVAVNLSRNHGHQLAVTAGLLVARGARVMVMDADLLDPPELLGDLMQAMDAGADVAYAQRRSRPGDAPLKRAACAAFYRLLNTIAEVPVALDTGDFRLMSRRVVDILNQMPERRRYIRGMVSWVGFRQVAVPYDRDARHAGETKYPMRKLIQLAIDGVTSSSVKPLAFANVCGVLAGGVGLVILLYSVISWLFVGQTPPGWASLMVVIALLGSAQLFVLGIIGEYLGRLWEQSRGRPMVLIDQVICGGAPRA